MATVVSQCHIRCVLPTQCVNDPPQARAWAVATLQCLAPVPIAPDKALIGRGALSAAVPQVAVHIAVRWRRDFFSGVVTGL